MIRPFISSFGSETAETRGFDALLGGYSLDRERNDLLRLALGVPLGGLADLADLVRGIGVCFFFHPMDQLRLRVGGCDSGELLEPAALFAKELVELLLALGQGQLTSAQSLGTPRCVALALLQQVVFAIELSFAVDDSTLLSLYLFASAANFDFPFLTKSDELFLATEDRRLAEALRFALGIPNDSLR